MSFLNLAEPVTLQRSPILTNRAPAPACSTLLSSISRRDQHRLEPSEQRPRSGSRDGARRAIAHRPSDCGNVLRGRPAATADGVNEAAPDPIANLTGGLGRRLVIFS